MEGKTGAGDDKLDFDELVKGQNMGYFVISTKEGNSVFSISFKTSKFPFLQE